MKPKRESAPKMLSAFHRWLAARRVRKGIADLLCRITTIQDEAYASERATIYRGIQMSATMLLKGIWLEPDTAAQLARALKYQKTDITNDVRQDLFTLAERLNEIHKEQIHAGQEPVLCFGIWFWTTVVLSIAVPEHNAIGATIWRLIEESAVATAKYEQSEAESFMNRNLGLLYDEKKNLSMLKPVFFAGGVSPTRLEPTP